MRGRAGRYARAGGRWLRLLTARGANDGATRVFYGHDRVPAPGERATGPTAKIQKLAARFPNHPVGFTHLYLASNWLPRDLRALVRLARRRGIPVVLNQDGVGYRAWAGDRADEVNRPLRRALAAADHVLYQSAFAKESADRFLGPPSGSWELLPNAVDVERFTPAEEPPGDGPVLLLGGDQTQAYRLELALRTFALVRRAHPDARLLVTGNVDVRPEPGVELLGEYSQRDAPAIFRRAHLLLHTKVLDPCPTVVLEAMACGLPVVHPESGGTVELVGQEAGIAVPHPVSWERDEPPAPEALAEAVERVLADLPSFSEAARGRAVERFALAPWLQRHAALFADLLRQ